MVTETSAAAPAAYPYRADDRPAGSPSAAPATSAVSWGAILAGAAASAALSLILLVLGTGLGMASSSPWADRGADAGTLGVAGILWLTVTGIIASALGGYLAGRLRTKWVSVHTDEVYFRDTAHGFLAWAVATLVTAAVLTSAASAVVGATARAGAAVAGGAATAAASAVTAGAAGAAAGGASESAGSGYFIDSLFRPAAPAAAAAPAADPAATPPAADASGTGAATTTAPAAAPAASAAPATATAPSTADAESTARTSAEVARIFANSLRTGNLPQNDVQYVGQLIAQKTGLSQQEAEKRVNDTFAKAKKQVDDTAAAAKEAADQARKASAYAALWLFVSLLISAFSASYAATIGGRRRDL